jgi:hypothetical protein
MGNTISLESDGRQVLIEADEDAQIQSEGLEQLTPFDQIQKGPQSVLSMVTPFWNALLKSIDPISGKPNSASAEISLIHMYLEIAGYHFAYFCGRSRSIKSFFLSSLNDSALLSK